jgi:hypothetical protein
VYNFVGIYIYIYIYMCVCVCVCLDLLTYTREEMNLYLKKGEQCVSECLQRKECVSKYSCVCYKDVWIKGRQIYMCTWLDDICILVLRYVMC